MNGLMKLGSLSLTSLAMSGDLVGLQQQWEKGDFEERRVAQSGAFQVSCSQEEEAIPLWILSQLSAARMFSANLETGLRHAANQGHLAVLKIVQQQAPWSEDTWYAMTLRALVKGQEACAAWLVPQGDANMLFWRTLDNWDEAYVHSHAEALALLDGASRYLSPADRAAWLDQAGRDSGELPLALGIEQAQARHDHLQNRPASPVLPRRRRS